MSELLYKRFLNTSLGETEIETVSTSNIEVIKVINYNVVFARQCWRGP